MGRSIRIKPCDRCRLLASVLDRVQYDESGIWVFAGAICWSSISQNHRFYLYGGTWKAHKKRKVEPIKRQGDRQVPQRSDLCVALEVCLGVPLGEKITSSTTPAK